MQQQPLFSTLYERLLAEQRYWTAGLVTQTPTVILHHAYEYSLREDLLLALEQRPLSDENAKLLLQSAHPLADLFAAFEQLENDHMDQVRTAIDYRIYKLQAKQKEDYAR